MKYPSVSVCFPVYNEEETVADVLRGAGDLLGTSGIEYEILVINDGSTDRSPDIINGLALEFPRIRVINHLYNKGIRQTFEELYLESRKDYIFINSVDKQWDTSILLDLLPLTEKADIIIASRKNKHYNALRTLVSWIFNKIPLLLFGVETYDAGAVKLIKSEIVRECRIISRSPFSEAERLIRAVRAGYRVMNYPVDVRCRETGKAHGVNIRVLVLAFFDVFRVKFSMKKR